MARPWIAAGTLLVAMETLADFGTVAAFNYDTFTSAIYKAWFAMFSIDAALPWPHACCCWCWRLIALEGWSRRRQRYHRHVGGAVVRHALGGWQRWPARSVPWCWDIAFVVPVGRLLYLAAPTLGSLTDASGTAPATQCCSVRWRLC
jgi:iron(III) transport system permease protein